MTFNELVRIYLLVFVLHTLGSQCSPGSSGEVNRDSLIFLLPDPLAKLGHECLQRSFSFCLMGYKMNTRVANRQPRDNDEAQFQQLIQNKFQTVNWFSFKPDDAPEGCCSYQTGWYKEFGQRNGLSPASYYNIVFNFMQGRRDEQLVFVKVRWNPAICMNVIEQLGFGRGLLKTQGGKGLTKRFVMPPSGGSLNVNILKGTELKRVLDFRWFMTSVVCVEKPELCPPNSDLPASSRNSELEQSVPVFDLRSLNGWKFT